MRILFDHGTPRGLIRALPSHIVLTALSKGWDRLSNGDLIQAGEAAEFDLLLTTDRRIRYQQNLSNRKIAIVILAGCTKWTQVRNQVDRINEAIANSHPGSFTEVLIPFD